MARSFKRKRIGVFDATLNPVHRGHMVATSVAAEEAELDEAHFAVSRAPTNRDLNAVLPAELRFKAAAAYAASDPKLVMSRVNLRSRNQNAPNYAVTTMEETHRDFPNAELFGMMSGEYLDPQARWFIKNWTGARRLFELSTMLFFPRWDQTCAQLRDWSSSFPRRASRSFTLPACRYRLRSFASASRTDVRFATSRIRRWRRS